MRLRSIVLTAVIASVLVVAPGRADQAVDQAMDQAKNESTDSGAAETTAQTTAQQTTAQQTTAQRAQLGLEDMRTFTEVFARLQRDYVEEISDQELMERAIRGMLDDLDPHTAYLTREQFQALEEDTTGRYGGVGIEVRWLARALRVVAVTPGSPADRGGVRKGDVLLTVDGESIEDMVVSQVVEHVRGLPGLPVRLGLRDPEDREREVVLEREIIRVASVERRLFGEGFGYLRLITFQEDTDEAVAEAVTELAKRAGGRLDGLVLDLRQNPGGVLNSAVGVADLFLESGAIVSTRGRSRGALLDYSAGPDDMLRGAPLVVLVDQATASASEIVAGALKDHERAVILGERTFGKGSVQTVLPLPNGGGIKLTTARYYTPSGLSIQAKGIQPDIDLSGDARGQREERLAPEARLPGHLSNDARRDMDADELLALAEADYGLYRALMLLRGAHLLGRAEVGD